MLLDAATPCRPLRPPGADEPTPADLSAVCAGLRSVVDNWQWAVELGLRMTALEPLPPGAEPDGDHCVAYAIGGGSALLLRAEVAAGIVRLSLGGAADAAPDGPGDHLSAVDLAVLDVWAQAAVGAVAGVLGVDDPTPRRIYPPPVAARDAPPRLLGRLSWAGERPAGALVFAAHLARRRPREHGPALGERPAALLHATVRLSAQISGPPVPLAELLALEVGDVVLLGPKTALEVRVDAAGETVALGRPGAQGERMAVRIAWLSEALYGGPTVTEEGRGSCDG